MAGRNYLTVADELLAAADGAIDYFEEHGYDIAIEPSELEFPFTPTACCRRTHTVLFVEVDSKANLDRLEEWSRYTRSCSADTRIALAVPEDAQISPKAEHTLSELGIGLYSVFPDKVIERLPAKDQSLNAQLPPLRSLPPALRQALGPIHEQFERGQWREGFEDACQVLEVEARRHLLDGMKSGKFVLVTPKGNPSKTTQADVGKMPLGALAEAYAQIQTTTQADSQIASVLKAINPARVGVAHYKRAATAEAALRLHVGQHMWKIISALKNLL